MTARRAPRCVRSSRLSLTIASAIETPRTARSWRRGERERRGLTAVGPDRPDDPWEELLDTDWIVLGVIIAVVAPTLIVWLVLSVRQRMK
jgi:hypothetical protein